MVQISNKVFIEEAVLQLDVPNQLLPNPYFEFPFLIIDNFLTNESCDKILSQVLNSNDFEEAKLRKDFSNSHKNNEIRKTNIFKISQNTQFFYDEAFLKHKAQIENFFAKPITTSTNLQILGYNEGFFYKSHSDDSSFLVDNHGQIIGFKLVAPNRKITTVVFANDDFEGGELEFNFLKYPDNSPVIFKPKKGSLIAFLSNSFFTHEVKTITKGFRLSLVQWHDILA